MIAANLNLIGDELESAVKTTLQALEEAGISARDADEFIRDAVFNAWADWDYEPSAPDGAE